MVHGPGPQDQRERVLVCGVALDVRVVKLRDVLVLEGGPRRGARVWVDFEQRHEEVDRDLRRPATTHDNMGPRTHVQPSEDA